MTSIFSAVSYIKDVLEGNRSYTGTAVYRSSEDEFVKYKFKVFRSEVSSLVGEVKKNSISLVIGQFTFEDNELNVRKKI